MTAAWLVEIYIRATVPLAFLALLALIAATLPGVVLSLEGIRGGVFTLA